MLTERIGRATVLAVDTSQSPFWTVEEHSEHAIVIVTRLAVPFDGYDDVGTSFEFLIAQTSDLDRAAYGLLLDFRDAPIPRADQEFEHFTRDYRLRLFEGFAGVAILVKTLSGMMQMSRTSSEDGQVYRPFDDEREAQAFLEERLRTA